MAVVPKKSGLINEREKEICLRVRAVREAKKWSQKDFCAEVGITRDKLASVEYGRTPLRYDVGDMICRESNICQRWLATGLEPKHPYLGVAAATTALIPAGILFSGAYDRYLDHQASPVLESFRAEPGITSGEIEPEKGQVFGVIDGVTPAEFEKFAAADAVAKIRGMPPRLRNLWLNNIHDLWLRFLSVHGPEFVTFQREQDLHRTVFGPGERMVFDRFTGKISAKGELTEVSVSANNGGVKPKLPTLLERLRKASAQRGLKSALAAFLGVPLASVSQWLSGVREPGGETTLRLLEWVQVEEAKQTRGSGGADNTTRAKTRLRKISDEKPKPSPP